MAYKCEGTFKLQLDASFKKSPKLTKSKQDVKMNRRLKKSCILHFAFGITNMKICNP